ncbi:MAG: hypothetical protein ABI654_13715 [Betaproteobacteria bacterium]
MLQISAIQLAELLSGIGRAQAAVVQGLESEMAGIRSGRIVPAVQSAAHLRDHPDPTLVDLPVRILMSSMGRAGGADPAAIARELERLINGVPVATSAPATAAPAAAPAAAAPAADAGGDALDFSKPA